MILRFLYRALKTRYRDERCEVRELLRALSPKDIAVDIGANKGSYLLWLSRAVHEGKVVAFEPQQRLVDYLRQVCLAAGLSNVVIEGAGISETNGSLDLFVPGGVVSPGASFEHAIEKRELCRTVQVPVFSLDDYFRDTPEKIGAIKVDVEGHELAVFRGAERILREHSPLLVFECEARHMTTGTVSTVLDFLTEKGYDGYFVHRSRLRPIAEFRVEEHQKDIGDRFWDSADYCNNFIMKKSCRI